MRLIKAKKDLSFENGLRLKQDNEYLMQESEANAVVQACNARTPGLVELVDEDIDRYYTMYRGEDLNDKKIFIWTFDGAEGVIYLSSIAKVLKEKYPNAIIHMACDSVYHDLVPMDIKLSVLSGFPANKAWFTDTDYQFYFTVQYGAVGRKYDNMTPAQAILKEWNLLEGLSNEDLTGTIAIDQPAIERANKFFEFAGFTPEDFIVCVQPHVDNQVKEYPLAFMIETVKGLVECGAKIVWIGKSSHHSLIQNHVIKPNGWDNISLDLTTARVSWDDLCSVIASSDVVLSADHYLLQLGGLPKTFHGEKEVVEKYPHQSITPVVGLYGSVRAQQRIGTQKLAVGITGRTLCTGCNQPGPGYCRIGFPSPCMMNIAPDVVAETVIRLATRVDKTRAKLREEDAEIVPMEQWLEENETLKEPLPPMDGVTV